MGVWEWIYTAADFAKRNTPGVAPVMAACQRSYAVGRGAANHVDGAVRTKARELHDYFSDDQVRANVTRIATSLSKNGALYLARCHGIITLDTLLCLLLP